MIKSTEQELHYAASVYGDVFFQSLTEDEKKYFKQIMDSQKKSNLDSNNISELLTFDFTKEVSIEKNR